MDEKHVTAPEREQRDRRFFALILIVVGLLALLPNIVTVPETVGLLVPIGLGLVFLAWGLLTRRFGVTVPGCILTGLGAGVILAQPQTNALSGNVTGGIIVLGLAAGFCGIAIMNLLFNQKPFWWPLIPGVILGVVGTLLTVDSRESMNLLEQIGRYWPVILLVIGAWMLLGRREEQHT
jgi:hypothetical protein